MMTKIRKLEITELERSDFLNDKLICIDSRKIYVEGNGTIKINDDYLTIDDKLVVDKKESCAILKNFNGFYPSKETLYELDFPSVDVYFKDLDDGRRQEWLRQRFYQMSRDEVNYPKKLVRMKDNYHYE